MLQDELRNPMNAQKIRIAENRDAEIFENQIKKLPIYLKSSELAKILGVSIHTIRSWRKLRVITPKVFGRSVRWLLDNVLEELSKGSVRNEKS